MANMASTSYRIVGKKEDLQKIYDLWYEFETKKRKPIEKGSDGNWEGNIALALGIDIEKKYLRGWIETCEFDGDMLKIEAEEAWGVTDFRHCLTESFKDLEVFFLTEELGCGVFQSNDKDKIFFNYSCLMDIFVNHQSEWEYYDNKEQALTTAARMLGIENITMEEVEKFNEQHEEIGDDDENYIHLYELQIVEV